MVGTKYKNSGFIHGGLDLSWDPWTKHAKIPDILHGSANRGKINQSVSFAVG